MGDYVVWDRDEINVKNHSLHFLCAVENAQVPAVSSNSRIQWKFKSVKLKIRQNIFQRKLKVEGFTTKASKMPKGSLKAENLIIKMVLSNDLKFWTFIRRLIIDQDHQRENRLNRHNRWKTFCHRPRGPRVPSSGIAPDHRYFQLCLRH